MSPQISRIQWIILYQAMEQLKVTFSVPRSVCGVLENPSQPMVSKNYVQQLLSNLDMNNRTLYSVPDLASLSTSTRFKKI